MAADSEVIQQFVYDDTEAWPQKADDDGHSMVIRDVSADFNDGTNWRASTAIGGTPGVSDLDALFADLNSDGEVDFGDFLLLSANFGRQDATYEEGDINDDGAVTFADFLIMSAQFGTRRN